MYALFEDAGKFLAGRVMSETDSSLQVELDSGKRVKVKAAQALLRFEAPQPAELIATAQSRSNEIELDLAWEFAPEEDFSFSDLARDYFSDNADSTTLAAMLLRLFEAPHYFRRLGKGMFKKAPEEVVKAALLGIERKQQQAAQIADWARQLADGQCPEPIREQLYRILFKPDKNGPEYKAVVEASRLSHRAALDLLTSAGAIDSPYQFHWRRFLFENFPRGTGFPDLPAPAIREDLPLSPAEAFSIDDSTTTEIDDALSVQGLGTGTVMFGVHIAAPGLAISPDSPLDKVARERLSTVYMPGHKITMLPDEVVQAYTLQAGRECPAVSLYLTIDEATLAIQSFTDPARARRDRRQPAPRPARCDGHRSQPDRRGAGRLSPIANELRFAYRLARQLKHGRETVRGKPETFNRPDYSFRLEGQDGSEPRGDEAVSITPRRRGAPLDLIVAEAMILANSTWGGWLAECGVPGIYRSQASMAPGIKVRMGVKPAAHAGMGVAHYTWATSPLRRYVDLVNQWQIIACARHGMTAALAAPFKPRDAALFSIISAFDAAHAAYNAFQSAIERYWTLQYLAQHRIEEFEATVMKEGLVRAETLPLVFRALGAESLPRGALVRVRVASQDLLTLDLQARVQSRLDDALVLPATAAAVDDEIDGGDDEAAGDGDAASGPLTIAIDLPDGDEASAGAEQAAPRPARREAGRRCRLTPRTLHRWRPRDRPGPALDAADALLFSVAVHAALLSMQLRDAIRGRRRMVDESGARGDPRQFALGRGAGEGAGDRPGQPHRRWRQRAGAQPVAAAGFERTRGRRHRRGHPAQDRAAATGAGAAAGGGAARARDDAGAQPGHRAGDAAGPCRRGTAPPAAAAARRDREARQRGKRAAAPPLHQPGHA